MWRTPPRRITLEVELRSFEAFAVAGRGRDLSVAPRGTAEETVTRYLQRLEKLGGDCAVVRRCRQLLCDTGRSRTSRADSARQDRRSRGAAAGERHCQTHPGVDGVPAVRSRSQRSGKRGPWSTRASHRHGPSGRPRFGLVGRDDCAKVLFIKHCFMYEVAMNADLAAMRAYTRALASRTRLVTLDELASATRTGR